MRSAPYVGVANPRSTFSSVSIPRPTSLLTSLLVLTLAWAPPTHGQWSQWGGPERNFAVETDVALEPWGELGPRLLWFRELGPGYSGIVVDGGKLVTMTRQGPDEVLVALSAADGGELWRHTYAAPTEGLRGVDSSYGDAPQATPMVYGGRVFGLGYTGVLSAVDATTGEALWSHDLVREHGTGIPYFGHAASPLRVSDTVVVLAGGAIAFELESGALRWQNRDFAASYASAILVDSPTGPQLVAGVAGEVVGLDPTDGRLLWRQPHANRFKTFLSTPVLAEDGTLFASVYFLGSLGLRFAADGTTTRQWELESLQVGQSNALALGGMAVASHNRNLVAVDLASGQELWRHRGLRRSTLIRVGERLLALNERGQLTLAEVSRSGFEPLAETQLLEGRSWTAPTLVGQTLYARNGQEILAVDLATTARTSAETVGARRSREPVEARSSKEFVRAVAAVEAAALKADSAALEEALAALEPWAEDATLAPHVAYQQGFAAWQRSLWGPAEERLAQVDAGVEALLRAIELAPRWAEPHALLSPLYSAYYQLQPARAAVVGSLGDDYLSTALEWEPQNPRVMLLHGIDLLRSPATFGGDPVEGRSVLEEAIERFETLEDSMTPGPGDDPNPRWGPILARIWLAQDLRREGDPRAKQLLEQALDRAPDAALPRQLAESWAAEDAAE